MLQSNSFYKVSSQSPKKKKKKCTGNQVIIVALLLFFTCINVLLQNLFLWDLVELEGEHDTSPGEAQDLLFLILYGLIIWFGGKSHQIPQLQKT